MSHGSRKNAAHPGAHWVIGILAAAAAMALVCPRTSAQSPAASSAGPLVELTAKAFKGYRSDADLLVQVGEIRLHARAATSNLRYRALGLALYQGRSQLATVWKNDVQGALTAAQPVVTLPGPVFIVPNAGTACTMSDCSAVLLLEVETGPGASHIVRAELAPVQVDRPPPRAPASRPAIGPPTSWPSHFAHALRAFSERRYGDTERLLAETLAYIEKTRGPSDPAAARVHYQRSLLYERLKRQKQQEQALLAALAILEKYPDPQVQGTIGRAAGPLDKEIVARRLADLYWEARRYADAYTYYDRAYRYVADVPLTDAERNRRLARNSAGRMAGACTQKNWAVADEAMAELKRRIVDVDAETRRQLEYWIRTGEPRLKARQC